MRSLTNPTGSRAPGRDLSGGAPAVVVGALGKHPVVPDHVPGIGLSTVVLRAFKQEIYDHGFEPQMGTWRRLDAAGQSIPWGHTYVSRAGRDIVLARLWASRDKVGRAEYPMILCVHANGASMEWMLGPALAQLLSGEAAVKAAATADGLQAAVLKTRQNLQALAAAAPPSLPPHWNRQGFDSVVQSKQMQEAQTLLRLVGAVGDLIDPACQVNASASPPPKYLHVRVPACGATPTQALGAWSGFTAALADDDVRVALICPDSNRWMDVLFGDLPSSAYFCFRAGDETLKPLARIKTPLSNKQGQYAASALTVIANSFAEFRSPAEAAATTDAIAQIAARIPIDSLPAEIDPADRDASNHTPIAAGQSMIDATASIHQVGLHAREKSAKPTPSPSRNRLLPVAASAGAILLIAVAAILLHFRGHRAITQAAPPSIGATDPDPNWVPAMMAKIKKLRDIDGPLAMSVKQISAAFPMAASEARVVQANFQREVDDLDQSNAAAQTWSRAASADILRARQATVRSLENLESDSRHMSGSLLQVALRHAGDEEQLRGPPFDVSWPKYLNLIKTDAVLQSQLPASAVMDSLEHVRILVDRIAAAQKALLVLKNLPSVAPDFDSKMPQKDPWLLEMQKVRETETNWLQASRFNYLSHLEPDDAAMHLDDHRRHLGEMIAKDSAIADNLWNYWCDARAILAEPCQVQSGRDVCASIKDFDERNQSSPSELTALCDQSAGELATSKAVIASLVTASPKTLVKTIIADRSPAKDRALVIAAWQRLAQGLASAPWPTSQADEDEKMVGAVFAAMDAAPDSSQCREARKTFELACKDHWLEGLRNSDQSRVEPILKRSKVFHVDPADFQEIVGKTRDEAVRGRLYYDILAFNFNRELRAADGPIDRKRLGEFVDRATELIKGLPRTNAVANYLSGLPVPKRIDPSSAPFAMDASLWKKEEQDGVSVVFSAADSVGVKVVFNLVNKDRKEKDIEPYYLCTTELSVGVLNKIISSHPMIFDKLISMNENRSPGVRAWSASRASEGKNIVVKADWLDPDWSLDETVWKGVRGGGRGIEKPSVRSPVTDISPEFAQAICKSIGVRLPSVAEWRCAYRQFELYKYNAWVLGQPTTEPPNLRDRTFDNLFKKYHVKNNVTLVPMLQSWRSFAATLPQFAAVSGPQEDGVVWFRQTPDKMDYEFHDLVGNVAEWVTESSGAGLQYRVIGLSALSSVGDTVQNTRMEPDTPYDPKTTAESPMPAFGDVGMRLAFDAPKPAAVEPAIMPAQLENAPYLGAR